MTRRPLLTISLVLCLLSIINLAEELRLANASPYTDVDVHTAHDMITNGSYPNLVLLDVRTKSEYDEGHIYKAVWIPVAELESRIDELAGHEYDDIIVYCRSGGRSVTASSILDSYNFTRVYNMLGGISAWQSASYPVWIATVHNINTAVNYDTIQAAIDAAQTLNGHIILVEEGIYYEEIIIHKSLMLVGEDRSSTIIDGNETGHVITITVNNVTVNSFTIQGSNPSRVHDVYGGIRLQHATHCNVSGNLLTNNSAGIIMAYSDNNTLTENDMTGNWVAVALAWDCNYNVITGNNLTGSREMGLYLDMSYYNEIRRNNIVEDGCGIRILDSMNNRIFHNNFMSSNQQVCNSSGSTNFWDNGCEGNYWDNYDGTDLDGDGVGDTELPWEGVEYHPLMNLYWNPSDINHDLKVDMEDVGNAARAFGTEPGDEDWNPHADITGRTSLEPDNKVNMRDIGLTARDFGETYSFG